MLMVIGIFVIAIIIIAIEVPYLKKNKLKKESWVFSILLIIGVGLSIAYNLHLYIPNPLQGLAVIFKPFSDFVNELLI
ncbi:hypothetical protein V7122_13810 [Bacillus sp. JJ1532]|uniref:hypothetical protein n=1 Tax=unclassified Bacillus (in: firmicutes) TaxID=185979 RepID=UPI0030005134